MRLDLVFQLGKTKSGGVFCSVCELIMILDSLSANGWNCVPVLLVVLYGVVQHWSVLVVGRIWVLVLRWRSLGELLLIDIKWD